MIDLLQHSSVPSTLPLPHPRPNLQNPNWSQPSSSTHAAVEGGRAREGSEPGRGNPTQKLVAQWLASTAEGSPRGLQTPPQDMNGNVNQMLAPVYGSLYNHESTAKSDNSLYQRNVNAYNGRNPTPAAQPNAASQLSSPNQPRNSDPTDYINNTRRSSNEANQIVSYLQIPASINDSKGSLAEFAAQITCLFWFESSFTLHRVEESKTTPLPTTPLVGEAVPTTGFRKWVTTILSTTQVTQNVILLALMFIYRLKKLNPTVKGKAGSEFRLLTVALMLGNKFLDDNTYTNKTWAEVSGISVQEIHIMEVEFLSNMRYTLYASELEWTLWHRKLGRFWDYFDKASKSNEARPRGSLTPNLTNSLPLPSPPASQHPSPPFTSTVTPGPPRLHPLSMPPYMAPTVPSPMTRMPEVDLGPTSRKRSLDESSQEPSAKRLARTLPGSTAPALSAHNTPRLPIPNLSIATNGHGGIFPNVSGSYSAHLPPPANQTNRSMSMVYGNSSNWQPSGEMLTPTSQQPSGSLSTLPPMTEQLRRQSPMRPGSRTVSPTTSTFGPGTHDLLSPSGYPAQRNSPYRPVRGVNTLLVPPPSASLHNPSQHLSHNNMYYQPLGKPASERKTGIVPFMPYDSWQQLPQVNNWPPPLQPTFPQPNFRI